MRKENFYDVDIEEVGKISLASSQLQVFFSFLALNIPEGRTPINVLRDTWEAVVIYSFLMLILEYMGGEHLCLNSTHFLSSYFSIKNLLFLEIAQPEQYMNMLIM